MILNKLRGGGERVRGRQRDLLNKHLHFSTGASSKTLTFKYANLKIFPTATGLRQAHRGGIRQTFYHHTKTGLIPRLIKKLHSLSCAVHTVPVLSKSAHLINKISFKTSFFKPTVKPHGNLGW